MSKVYCQRLQDRTEDEELKCPGEHRNRHRGRG